MCLYKVFAGKNIIFDRQDKTRDIKYRILHLFNLSSIHLSAMLSIIASSYLTRYPLIPFTNTLTLKSPRPIFPQAYYPLDSSDVISEKGYVTDMKSPITTVRNVCNNINILTEYLHRNLKKYL